MSSSVFGQSVSLPVVIAVSGGTALFATYLLHRKKESKRYPPGPSSLPFVGNLFQLTVRKRFIPGLFNQWANKYGPLYIVELGKARAVVINTMPVLCEAMCEKGQLFSDRPNWLPLIQLIYEDRGLMWQSADTWKGVRQCAFGAMTGCGVGDHTIEERIQKETNKLIREFCKREEDGCPFYPMEILHKGVTNILSSIIFGCRYKYKSTQFQKFICMIRELSDTNVLDSTTFFPFLASLPVPRLKKAVKNMNELICHVEEEVTRHKENFDGNCMRDFIDLYLKELNSAGFLKKDDVCKQQMEVAIIDMFVCGSEPTSAALAWAILCMVAFPDIQAKCHEEIDCVVCEGRLPELADLCNMPYVHATLREVLRRFTVLPLGIPHSTRQDVGLAGFCIPANTIVICNLQAIHLNDGYWNSPCEFDPERFLDDEDDGDCGRTKLTEKDKFVPFGIGPRSCLGKELAWNILFLVFTGLMQRFDFQRGCDCDLAKCFEGKYRFTFSPLPYKIKIRCHCH